MGFRASGVGSGLGLGIQMSLWLRPLQFREEPACNEEARFRQLILYGLLIPIPDHIPPSIPLNMTSVRTSKTPNITSQKTVSLNKVPPSSFWTCYFRIRALRAGGLAIQGSHTDSLMRVIGPRHSENWYCVRKRFCPNPEPSAFDRPFRGACRLRAVFRRSRCNTTSKTLWPRLERRKQTH